eukprot:4655317-Pleurochrysis_carterae.AAC.1
MLSGSLFVVGRVAACHEANSGTSPFTFRAAVSRRRSGGGGCRCSSRSSSGRDGRRALVAAVDNLAEG